VIFQELFAVGPATTHIAILHNKSILLARYEQSYAMPLIKKPKYPSTEERIIKY